MVIFIYLKSRSPLIVGKCVCVRACVRACVGGWVGGCVCVGACKCQCEYVTFDWWVQKLQYFVLVTLQTDNSKTGQLSTKYRVK